FLKDRGYITAEEPFKKLINQGMILGTSAFVYGFSDGLKDKGTESNLKALANKQQRYIISKKTYDEALKGIYDDVILNLIDLEIKKAVERGGEDIEWDKELSPLVAIHVDVSFVNASSELDIEGFRNWRKDFSDFEFILNENGKYI